VFSKYATFSGRAPRSEYWYWTLFYWVGLFVILEFTKLYPIWELGLFIPNLAVGVRRMHDSNHSGWWIICPIANIVLLFFPSTGPNRFDAGASPQGIDGPPLGSSTSACVVCGKLRLPGQNFCQGCGAKFD
jgi:uncharacterized membrane protein YhaH (DUF805 family)